MDDPKVQKSLQVEIRNLYPANMIFKGIGNFCRPITQIEII